MTDPTPSAIRAARLAAGHTQSEAAAAIYSNRTMTWADYEARRRNMPLPVWHWYLLVTNQHPKFVLSDRA